MKKILSLALALLMMLPLAIGTSAATTIVKNNSKDVVTAEEFKNILDYWQWSQLDQDDYKEFLEYLYAYDKDFTRSWKDKCEQCGKAATYYVSKGNVYCTCTKCNETYKIDLNDTSCKYCNCDDCDTRETYCDCDCKKCGCVDPGFTIDPEKEFKSKFTHRSKYCELDDLVFYDAGTKIVWYCQNCYADGWFKESEWDDAWLDYFWDYKISVYCSRGGSYSINGSMNVDRGDTRTITFEANPGYVLYDVTVNGVDYGCPKSLTLTITENTVVRASFVKEITLKTCNFSTTVVGGGSVVVKKNSKTIDADKFTAKYNDTITYKFNPASSNYTVKNVTVNGRSLGKIATYTIDGGITKDYNVKVTFEWNNPYNDVADNYLTAVEYVTEAGIMGYYNKYVNKNAFCGTKEISVKNLAAALAEMADVNDKLDTVDERIEWAAKNGIIDDSADLTVTCTVQAACDIVYDYLCLIEDAADVDFEDFDDDDSAKENALSIDLVSETTYKKNRKLTRYDLAAICSLIANLEIDD